MWRAEIEQIDYQILDLLEKRFACAQEIGAIKHKAGLPILDPERETSLIQKYQASCSGHLSLPFIKELFQMIFEESRRYQ